MKKQEGDKEKKKKMENQDWEYKVIHKTTKTKGQAGINQAIQQGKDVEAIKKKDHTNKNVMDGKKVFELIEDDETYGI